MAFSDSCIQLILEGFFGDDAGANAPTSYYLGLSTTTPTYDAGAITGVTEPSGGDYARVEVANTTANWTVVDRTVENAGSVEWPTATASWGDATHVVFYDVASAGSPLFFGALGSTATITSGIRLVLDPGGATISVPTS